MHHNATKCHENTDLTLSPSSSSSIQSITRTYAYSSALKTQLDLHQNSDSGSTVSTPGAFALQGESTGIASSRPGNSKAMCFQVCMMYHVLTHLQVNLLQNSNEWGPIWQAFLMKSFFKAGVFNCLIPDTCIVTGFQYQSHSCIPSSLHCLSL